MTPDPSSPAPDKLPAKSVQRQAAEWLALQQARALSTAEEAGFARWCAADPRHAAMFAEVEAAYRVFDHLAFYPRPPGRPVDPDLLARRRPGYLRPALAGMAVAAAVAVLVWINIPSAPTPAPPPRGTAADSRFLRLPDGSRVELNTGGEVAVHFTAHERRIRLVRGEAHFEVAKNPLRPFIVEADSVSVRAVGTAFDVRLGATAVDVLVTEGKVGVLVADEPWPRSSAGEPPPAGSVPAALGPGLILVAGQRTAVPTSPPSRGAPELVIENLTQHQIDRALAWQASRLVFDAMPLAEVVERFNRFATERDGPAALRLKVRGAGLEALRVSGRIRYDSVENFVQVLEEDFGVRADRHGSEIILQQDQ